ncbi:hypothetical protein E4T52_08296 [Aureobasidium sp. EXF-3400]|nr:hypothetical protein E4T51_11548 [Aureobasidium sp. EXF-12344]KAI4776791.1 hypothetical protein E4T52_08296 [Aureobasidium sp. EXF-3400]
MKIAQMLHDPIEETHTRAETKSRDVTTSTSISSSPISTLHTTSGVVKTPKTRRRQTKAACLGCRQRKSKCDGGRPSCKICTDRKTTCNYSVEQGKTQQQATKDRLKCYKEVVALIRKSSQKDSEAIVHILKSMDSLEDACRLILEGSALLPGR